MYESHWGVSDAPFRNCLNPRRFYRSPGHDEALARLHFLIEERRRLGLLLGSSGSGKSMILTVAADELRRGGAKVALINALGVQLQEFLWQVAAALELNPGPGESAFSLWRRLTDRIVANQYERLATVLLIDDADKAQQAVLEEITRLIQIDASEEARTTVVIASTPETVGCLGHRLLELSELRIDLVPWQQADVEQYIRFSLSRVGRDDPAFGRTALERLHQLTQGIPRQVNHLAELSLVVGAGQELDAIDASTVESVFSELGHVETAPSPS